MNNTLGLVKVSLKESLDFREMKKNKGKTITFGVFILLLGAFFTFLSVVYNLLFAYMFKDFGMSIIYSTIVMVGLASALILATSITRVKALFIGKDHDLLASMPLTKREIISAKIITFYLTELLFSAIVMIPNIIINLILYSDYGFIPIGLVILFILPAFPIVLSCFVGTIIAVFAERSKFANIITTILYTVLLGVGVGFSFLSGGANQTDAAVMGKLVGLFEVFNPTSFILEFAYTKSFIWFLVYFVVNFILLVGIVLFLTLSYEPLHIIVSSSKSNIKYERKKLEVQNQYKALLKLEFKRLFNSKMYFLNTCFGGILAIIMIGMIGTSLGSYSEELGVSIISELGDYLHCGALLLLLVLGMTTPTACSINMEGKTFWLTKSLPIDYKDYVRAKISLSVIMLGSCSLVASGLMIFFLKPSIIQSFAIILIPLLFIIFVSCFDLFVNLYFYKLNYKNEQEAVKNSASTSISILVGFVGTIIVGASLIGLTFINMYLAIFFTIALLVAGSITMYLVLLKIVERRVLIIEQ